MLTFGCLGFYDGAPDPTVEVCGQLHPSLKPQLEEARHNWEARNAADILAMKSACQTRLNRVYGNNEAQMAIAKEQARRFQQAMNKDLLSDPNADNRVNCRAYMEDYSKGTKNIDSLKELIVETRDGAARPFEWKQ